MITSKTTDKSTNEQRLICFADASVRYCIDHATGQRIYKADMHKCWPGQVVEFRSKLYRVSLVDANLFILQITHAFCHPRQELGRCYYKGDQYSIVAICSQQTSLSPQEFGLFDNQIDSVTRVFWIPVTDADRVILEE